MQDWHPRWVMGITVFLGVAQVQLAELSASGWWRLHVAFDAL